MMCAVCHHAADASNHRQAVCCLNHANDTDPLILIHLASDSRYRVCPQVSLLPCRLDFEQVGLVSLNTHPLGNTNQFHPVSGNPEAPSLARHNDAFVTRLSQASSHNKAISPLEIY